MTDQTQTAEAVQTPKPKLSKIYALNLSADYETVLLMRAFAPPIKVDWNHALQALGAIGFYHRDGFYFGEIKMGGVPVPVADVTGIVGSTITVGYVHPDDDKDIYIITSAVIDTPETAAPVEAPVIDGQVQKLIDTEKSYQEDNASREKLQSDADTRAESARREMFKAATLAALEAREPTDRTQQSNLFFVSTGYKTRDAAFDAGLSIEQAIAKIDECYVRSHPATETAVTVVEQSAPTAELPANLIPLTQKQPNRSIAPRPQPPTDNRWWLSDTRWQLDPMLMARTIADSGMYSTVKTPAQAVLVMFKGIEMGLSPIDAFSHINIIGGKPAIDGQLMLAKLRQHGVTVKFIERSDEICRLMMTRNDTGETIEEVFTLEQAKRIGLTMNSYSGKESAGWKNYPKAMCTWRAVSAAARLLCPDILLFGGIPQYVNEELGADTNEDGSIR